MRFAHVSDFHYTFDPRPFGHVRDDIDQAFAKLVAELQRVAHHLDFVAVTGDLVERGDIESYLHVRNAFDKIGVRLFAVPGNHDLREPFRAAFADRLDISANGKLDYEARVGDTQIIGLDSLMEGKSNGQLTEDQLSWLEQKLAANEGRHSVVLLHHPPFQTGVGFFDRLSRSEGYDGLGEVLRRSKARVIVLSGHTHRPYQAVWNGAQCFVSGALASQYGGVEPFGDGAVGVVHEPYVYFIHALNGGDDHVVTTRHLDLTP